MTQRSLVMQNSLSCWLTDRKYKPLPSDVSGNWLVMSQESRDKSQESRVNIKESRVKSEHHEPIVRSPKLKVKIQESSFKSQESRVKSDE